jgi:hypothetical protein
MRKKQQDTKSMVMERQQALAVKMLEGLGFQREYDWYFGEYNKSEKCFQRDRTIIYRKWKLDNNKEISIRKMELIQQLYADRELARGYMQVGVSVQALKLIAQIEGILNKQNEPIVTINNNSLNFENVSTEDLIAAVKSINDAKK